MEGTAGELTYDVIVDTEWLEAIEHYLEGLHCTTWGKSFEIRTTNGRRNAAEWLYRQFKGVAVDVEAAAEITRAHAQQHNGSGSNGAANGNGKAAA